MITACLTIMECWKHARLNYLRNKTSLTKTMNKIKPKIKFLKYTNGGSDLQLSWDISTKLK